MARRLNLGSDLDYVRGRHSLRTGVALDAAWNRSDAASNYLGTYTFDSLDAFNAGQPSNYTERVGDPRLSYRMFQAAFYLQDDIRPVKNLTLSAGLRYEVQTHVGDAANFGPRFGVTWAPFKSGQTTLRGSAGMFYDWLPNGTYEQTLRVDGLRQQELNILNPTFPDPGNGRPDPADQPVFSGRQLPHAADHTGQRRRRPGTVQGRAGLGNLQLPARGAVARGLNRKPRLTACGRFRRCATSWKSCRTRRPGSISSRSMRRSIQARCCRRSRDRASAGSGQRYSSTTRWRGSRTTLMVHSAFRRPEPWRSSAARRRAISASG